MNYVRFVCIVLIVPSDGYGAVAAIGIGELSSPLSFNFSSHLLHTDNDSFINQ